MNVENLKGHVERIRLARAMQAEARRLTAAADAIEAEHRDRIGWQENVPLDQIDSLLNLIGVEPVEVA